MTFFNGAQSFYVDPSIVANSGTIDIASVGMYFMYRPSAINNKSGINFPGVTMFLTDVVGGVPNIANVGIYQAVARCEWNAVLTSSDASAETVFTFLNPVRVKTGKQYAFCWSYDGGEDFLPWTNTKGNRLVGSSTISSGPSSQYGGNYFLFSSIGQNVPSSSVQNYSSSWTPLNNTDAKFKVYVARYAIDRVPIAANLNSLPVNRAVYTSNLFFRYDGNGVVSVLKPAPRPENIDFDVSSSVKQAYVGSQRVFQNTVHYPGGGVWASVVTTGANTLTANAAMSNGAAFSWNSIYGAYAGDKYVVLDYGTSYDVRLVKSIVSNTVISVDEGTTVVNSAAKIMIAPVAVTDSFNTSILDGRKSSLMFLRDSSANSSVRFVGYSVDHSNVTFSNTGTGYSNSDVLYVVGYESVNGAITSNYPAIANLVTNSTGGVLSVNFSNVGAGFVNSAAATIRVLSAANNSVNSSTSNTSSGANLVPVFSYGSTLVTEQTNNVFRKCKPIDIDVHSALAVMNLEFSTNTQSNVSITTQYYLANGQTTANGFATRVGALQTFPLTLGKQAYLNTLENIPVAASRSNEFGFYYSNGAPNDLVSAITPYSNNYLVQISVLSNNDYVALGPFHSPLIDFGRYVFNNDYTNENTDSGNALARHITTTFNMSGPANTNRMAEDVRVWVSAWRPPTTDIQVFARIMNSTDTQSFIDEDWTRLHLIENSDKYSTTGYVDLTFGFQPHPNVASILVGSATTVNTSSNLVGSNTTWASSLVNNDLIKVYDPLFPNSNFAVCLATNVVNNTLIITDQIFSTNATVGIGGFELTGRGGLAVDKLVYDHQAFNNIWNDNVVRYYNQSEHVLDGFNVLQVKAVLLSPDPHYIPRIHNIRGMGVSA